MTEILLQKQGAPTSETEKYEALSALHETALWPLMMLSASHFAAMKIEERGEVSWLRETEESHSRLTRRSEILIDDTSDRLRANRCHDTEEQSSLCPERDKCKKEGDGDRETERETERQREGEKERESSTSQGDK